MAITSPAPDATPTQAATRGRQTPYRIGLTWTVAVIVLTVAAVVIVLLAGTRPGYDPYGWLAWGKLAVHGRLDTNGAPSWKPLPFLFTTPYALAGHGALWLWMVTAVAAAVAGAIFAGRIAFHLISERSGRAAAWLAAVCAAVALLGIRDYTHYVLSAQSDPMIVTLCLAAFDCVLRGRRRWALWLLVLASLGRPEAWPFLAVHAVWSWRHEPGRRVELAAGVLLVPLLWFGIPALTAKTWFVAGDNALHSPRELHQSKLLGTVDRLFDLHETTVWLAALAAVAVAVWRRERETLALAGAAVVWLVVEIAFVLHGWPGVPRYLFEPGGVGAVLAGVFVGRVAGELPGGLRARIARIRAGRRRRIGKPLGGLAAAAVIAALVIPLVPAAGSRWQVESRDLVHEQARAADLNRLQTVVARLGVARMLACAQPHIPIGYQSVFAWYAGIKIGALYVNRDKLALHPWPLLNFYPIRDGWKVFPSHLTAAAAVRCRGLTLVYRAA